MKMIIAFPQPVPSSLRCPTPPTSLACQLCSLIQHDQIGDAIGADDNAHTHLQSVWDLDIWLYACIVISCADYSGTCNSGLLPFAFCFLPYATARRILTECRIAQQAYAVIE